MNQTSTFNGHQRWLFRAAPLPGESLSSVVERSAQANAVSTRQYLVHLGLRVQGVDLDRLDAAAVTMHEDAFGYAPGTLVCTTLSSMIGQTFTRMTLQGLAEWCAGRGIRSKRADAVCPGCLADDSELYRRLHWRAAYVCRCELHDRDLIDQCPKCSGPVPTLAEMLARRCCAARKQGGPSWTCAQCGHLWQPPGDAGSVTSTQSRASSAHSLGWRPYQAAILRDHHPGSGLFPEPSSTEPPWIELGCNFTFQFLAGVRALLVLLHSPQAGKRLREVLAERLGCNATQLEAASARGRPIEVYPVAERRLALDAMACLLVGGIDGMLATMEEAGMTSSTLFLTDRYVPNWLHAPIASGLNGTRYSHSSAEIAGARAAAERSVPAAKPQENGIGDVRSNAAAAGRPRPAAILSKAAIGRLLGSRDSKALDADLGRLRRRYTRAEAEAFFTDAIRAVPQVPVSRTQRQVVIRTLLILLGVAVRGQTVEEVCGWDAAAVRSMLRDAPQTSTRALMAALQASEHGHAGAVLTSRFGARLRGASTRLCAARLLSQHGTEGTWNSANALAGVLAPVQATAGTKRGTLAEISESVKS